MDALKACFRRSWSELPVVNAKKTGIALIGLTTENKEVKHARKNVTTIKYRQTLDFRKFEDELKYYLYRRDRYSRAKSAHQRSSTTDLRIAQ